nr:MAG TPA: hypothetical protein [Caudoviricetes sp.]
MIFARPRAYIKVLVTLTKFNLLFLKIVKQGPCAVGKVRTWARLASASTNCSI